MQAKLKTKILGVLKEQDLLFLIIIIIICKLRAELKTQILDVLKEQGFSINKNSIQLKNQNTENLKKVHETSKLERINKNLKFIENNKNLILDNLTDGENLEVNNIKPKLIEIKPNTEYETLFRWWNLSWWSLPYEHPYGRQMRYVVWDEYHKSIIGLIGLQSPILHWGVRDKYLGIKKEKIDYWINQSMAAQRLGAIPPYNQILGGKLVASLMTTKNVKNNYRQKYKNKETLMEKRTIPPRLLFITTTGAYGKSSVYNRLKFKDEYIAKFIGYTKGYGSFQIPNNIYKEMIEFLEFEYIDTKRGYGGGPSKKIKLIDKALNMLEIKNGIHHGIKRSAYLFPMCENITDVINNNKRPKWHSRSIEELTNHWLERWVLPRKEKVENMKNFQSKTFINDHLSTLGIT